MIKNSAISTSPIKFELGGQSISTADAANQGVDWLVDALGGDSTSGWGQAASGVVGGVAGYFTGDWGGMIKSGGDFWGGVGDYADEDSGLGKTFDAMESSSKATGNYMQGNVVEGSKWTGEALRDTGSVIGEDTELGANIAALGHTSDETIGKVGINAVDQGGFTRSQVAAAQGINPFPPGTMQWKEFEDNKSPLMKKNKSIGDKKSTTMMLAVSHNPNTYGSMFGTK